MNCCAKGESGKHWICFHAPSYGMLEWFDPLGKLPSAYNTAFPKFINRHSCVSFIYNSRNTQSLQSITCGLHCIFFIIHRSMGYSMNEILSSIYVSDIPDECDAQVESFVQSLFSEYL